MALGEAQYVILNVLFSLAALIAHLVFFSQFLHRQRRQRAKSPLLGRNPLLRRLRFLGYAAFSFLLYAYATQVVIVAVAVVRTFCAPLTADVTRRASSLGYQLVSYSPAAETSAFAAKLLATASVFAFSAELTPSRAAAKLRPLQRVIAAILLPLLVVCCATQFAAARAFSASVFPLWYNVDDLDPADAPPAARLFQTLLFSVLPKASVVLLLLDFGALLFYLRLFRDTQRSQALALARTTSVQFSHVGLESLDHLAPVPGITPSHSALSFAQPGPADGPELPPAAELPSAEATLDFRLSTANGPANPRAFAQMQGSQLTARQSHFLRQRVYAISAAAVCVDFALVCTSVAFLGAGSIFTSGWVSGYELRLVHTLVTFAAYLLTAALFAASSTPQRKGPGLPKHAGPLTGSNLANPLVGVSL
jgi:hypothetical protein